MSLRFFATDVQKELERLRIKTPSPVHSSHEGWALIQEEVDELWDEVKKKNKNRDYNAMYNELVQIAARAQRMSEDVVEPKTTNPL